MNKLYSSYVINKSLAAKVKNINSVQNEVTNKKGDVYTVSYLPKSETYSCTCKYFSDGKCKVKKCSHILAVMHIFEKDRFWEEVSKDE